MKFTYLTDKRVSFGGSWSRKVEVEGKVYWVGVERGNTPIRIPYKPRGKGAFGYHWYGYVRDEKGNRLWHGRVPKSLGAKGILTDAGILPPPKRGEPKDDESES